MQKNVRYVSKLETAGLGVYLQASLVFSLSFILKFYMVSKDFIHITHDKKCL